MTTAAQDRDSGTMSGGYGTHRCRLWTRVISCSLPTSRTQNHGRPGLRSRRCHRSRLPSTPAEAFQIARDSDAPINERLATYAAMVRAMGSPTYAITDRLVERLTNAGAGLNAPVVGEPMPPFLLPDDAAHLVAWRSCSPTARWRLRSTADTGVPIAASTPMASRRSTTRPQPPAGRSWRSLRSGRNSRRNTSAMPRRRFAC